MLTKKKIIEDFINPKIQELGFEKVNAIEPYCPLKLKAHVRTQTLSGKACNNVVGMVADKTISFDTDKVYKLYVMFGKDDDGTMTMFCKEKKDDELCKIVDGNFVFEFNATMFFHILRFADINVWGAFTRYLTVKDREEIDKFASMVYNSYSLFEVQQRVGALFIENLYNGLY